LNASYPATVLTYILWKSHPWWLNPLFPGSFFFPCLQFPAQLLFFSFPLLLVCTEPEVDFVPRTGSFSAFPCCFPKFGDNDSGCLLLLFSPPLFRFTALLFPSPFPFSQVRYESLAISTTLSTPFCWPRPCTENFALFPYIFLSLFFRLCQERREFPGRSVSLIERAALAFEVSFFGPQAFGRRIRIGYFFSPCAYYPSTCHFLSKKTSQTIALFLWLLFLTDPLAARPFFADLPQSC